MTQQKIATIFGSTGFLGRYITQDLAREGYTIRAASRTPNKAFFLKPYGNVGQVVPFPCDGSKKDIEKAVAGADLVVNCVGILFEKKKDQFTAIHTDLINEIAKAAAKQNVARLVHVSALACDQGASKYAASKLAGEKKLAKAFPDAVILRPSVVFGTEDNFFNMFARMGRVLPALPLIGGGHTKFQPVYVGDIAEAVKNIATASPEAFKKFAGKVFELGGPDVVTFKDIYAKLKQHAEINFIALPLPWAVAKIEAAILGLLPKPLLTTDQVESLKTDNVVAAKGAKTLADLGVKVTSMDAVLPSYLKQYSYKKRKAAAA